MNALIERFALDTRGSIRRFSKGMKQKLGIVAAFMHDPRVLILDEPTSGLDPLMQNEFIRLVLEEKQRGKTILLSSHIFEEVERTCDDVVIIRDGRIAAQSSVQTLTSAQCKGYHIRTPDVERLKAFGYRTEEETAESCVVYVSGEGTPEFFRRLGTLTVRSLDVKAQTLEDAFLHFYSAGGERGE